MVRLGVNIDHIATLRQVRGVDYPDLVEAAMIVAESGADGITLHLREDRRHIQDSDVRNLKLKSTLPMNLEMSTAEDIIKFSEEIKPEHCCLVPENREELTTEGGLDVAGQLSRFEKTCSRLEKVGIVVSLFIDPEEKQIHAAKTVGASVVEIHTGYYANATRNHDCTQQLKRIINAATYANSLGLIVNAGHGLTINNVQLIAAIPMINELNIGHSIIARAVLIGLSEAVREMKKLIVGV